MKNAIDEKIEMTAGERAFIDRFVTDYCRPHRVVMAERLAAFVAERQMAFVSGETADFALAAGPRRSSEKNGINPIAPDEEVRFAFASEGERDAADAWRAELRVPPKATSEKISAASAFPSHGLSPAAIPETVTSRFAIRTVSLPCTVEKPLNSTL